MSKYLYNGIPLPDINTVWTDKTTYPYAIIFGDEYGGEFLHISPVPFIYEDPNVNISSGAGSPRYINDSDGWVEHDSGSGCTGSGVKWTNYDIIDISDNSVYLAASEPVSVNLKSWLIGFALGLAGKPLPFAKNEPVDEPIAYLYNGVQLIPLPQWDKAAYPYAVIDKAVLNSYRLHLFAHLPHAENAENGYTHYGPMDGSTYIYKGVAREWSESGWSMNAAYEDIDGISTSRVLWTNFDLLYTDGKVCCAKSDPIPVYE